MEHQHAVPIWFFVGLLMLVYGVLIVGAGIAGWSADTGTVLHELHAPVWWGGIMLALGLWYTVKFRPLKK